MDQYQITSDNVRLLGRTLNIGGITWLGWSASGIEFATNADSVRARITGITVLGKEEERAWLGIIREESGKMERIRIEPGTHDYELCRNPSKGPVHVRVIKLTEAQYDKVGIGCLYANGYIRPTSARSHRILFIGDSITAGYGVLGQNGRDDVFTTANEDVTKAYPYRTAEALQADSEILGWSGNGVISHSIDEGTDLPDTKDLMPAIVPFVDKNTEQVVRIVLSAKGIRDGLGTPGTATAVRPEDFVPEVIVSNLGTNDAYFTKGIPVREQHFVRKYVEFLRGLKEMWPEAGIVVTYGLMERSLFEANEEAASLSESDFLELPLQDPADGLAAAGHPGEITEQKVTDLLTAFLREKMGWQ